MRVMKQCFIEASQYNSSGNVVMCVLSRVSTFYIHIYNYWFKNKLKTIAKPELCQKNSQYLAPVSE